MADPVPERVFLGWDKPLLIAVRDWLLSEPDLLAETLVVVPTANSGRRLRQMLSDEGKGMLAPNVAVSRHLFQVEGIASQTQQVWAWVKVVQSIAVEDFPQLFPNHSSEALNSFRAALGVAQQLSTLRDSLADADKGFQDVVTAGPEKERWLELCKLESKMLDVLKSWKLRDPVLAQRRQSHAPELPVGVRRIVVAGVPDPSLLALNALQVHLRSDVPVTVLVSAPGDESHLFDAWGVPDPQCWSDRQILFPEWGNRFHVVESARDAADQVVQIFARNATPSNDAALVLCDTSLAPNMERAFTDAGWPLYDPDGKPVTDTGIARLIRCAGELLGHDAPFEAARELVRIPGAEMFLPDDINRKWAARLMDNLHHDHLPDTLADAHALASDDEKRVVGYLRNKIDEATSENSSRVVKVWLTEWLKSTDQDLARKSEPFLAEVLDSIEHMEARDITVPLTEAMEMLNVSLRGARLNAEKGNEVLDMEGWLEISYDAAPHLVLAGMHEGCVPDSAVDDVFLPDSLKQELGMRDASGRYARDAFLLTSAIRARGREGRVDVIVSRFNDAGEARNPSRLLMQWEGEELPQVVKHLFDESDGPAGISGPWTRDWELAFPDAENKYSSDPPRALSPSAIKDYMNCPMRFFLKRVVGMESFESEKREMDALDFGNLCHRVLEIFGKDPSVRDSIDESEVEQYLSEALDRCVEMTYGKNVHLPLMVQVESARERLKVFARKQVAERVMGWRIVETEFQVGGDDGVPWEFSDHPVRMMIDRIDCNDETGSWRVWDYKTTGKAKSPEEQHLKPWNESENRPLLGEMYPPAPRGRSERRWADVQLPLYAAFVKEHFQTGQLPEVGYINLPRAVTDVGFVSWGQFDEATLEHARVWAGSAIKSIVAGDFKQVAVYPAGERDWDDFGELAPDGLDVAFGINQG